VAIFINYRRQDAQAEVGRIYDRLLAEFGDSGVYRDINSIPGGANFRTNIEQALDECDVVLVVIGQRWLSQRLQTPEDPVRVEIEGALARKLPILPLLVSSANMPPTALLPPALQPLVDLNAVRIDSGRDFDNHIQNLLGSIHAIRAKTKKSKKSKKWGAGKIAVVVAILTATGMLLFFLRDRGSSAAAAATSTLSAKPQPQSGSASTPERFDVLRFSTPSGYMGDAVGTKKYVQQTEASRENPHSPPTAVRVAYDPGPGTFAGMCWQNKPDNAGQFAGRDLQNQALRKISFWVRGSKGNEVVELLAGGEPQKDQPFQNSFSVSSGRITLGTAWQHEEISLEGKDLSSVIHVFCWTAAREANPTGSVFYIDDIFYEP